MRHDEIRSALETLVGQSVVGVVLDPRDIGERRLATLTGVLQQGPLGYEIHPSSGMGSIQIDTDSIADGVWQSSALAGSSPGRILVLTITRGLTLTLTEVGTS